MDQRANGNVEVATSNSVLASFPSPPSASVAPITPITSGANQDPPHPRSGLPPISFASFCSVFSAIAATSYNQNRTAVPTSAFTSSLFRESQFQAFTPPQTPSSKSKFQDSQHTSTNRFSSDDGPLSSSIDPCRLSNVSTIPIKYVAPSFPSRDVSTAISPQTSEIPPSPITLASPCGHPSAQSSSNSTPPEDTSTPVASIAMSRDQLGHIDEVILSRTSPTVLPSMGAIPETQDEWDERKEQQRDQRKRRRIVSSESPSLRMPMPKYNCKRSRRWGRQQKAIEWLSEFAFDEFQKYYATILRNWGVAGAHSGTCVLNPVDWAGMDPLKLAELFVYENCPLYWADPIVSYVFSVANVEPSMTVVRCISFPIILSISHEQLLGLMINRGHEVASSWITF